MGSITIKTDKSFMPVPCAFNCFNDAAGRPITVMPIIDGDSITWNVPDTQANRDLLKSGFEPSGMYECETVDLETPKPFSVSRKEVSKQATPPKTVTKAK